MLTHEDMMEGLDQIQAELYFLRFFYNAMKELCSDAGTDEVYYVTDMYRNENGEPPKQYGGV